MTEPTPSADDVTPATPPIDKTMVAAGLIGLVGSGVALVIALFSAAAPPPPPAFCLPPHQLVQTACQ
ncbi:hypothetical protein A5672_18740 [Mycobacterium alsense]|uniref:DUF2613 domain-containing protein n=1 Tax=Mycobacterium alsense TaxID=324058 RepID=A0ABD6NZL0_9MYCO|nr:hypothetical protein [Mycobacterium alsense]OBG36958.1 hypothetical protein A5672_18740 [Mycobacterium alsense]OBJ05252.1 hypothetical protein A5660_01425 [Mycobacterium alsense]